MNKKFSTLVASVLLAGAVGTVNAATPVYAQYKTAPDAATVVYLVSYISLKQQHQVQF